MEEYFTFEIKLIILCLDDEVKDYIKSSKLKIKYVDLTTLEGKYKELAQAKQNRQKVEYFYTLSAGISKYCFDNENFSSLTYVDSDIFFFSCPNEIFKQLEGKNIGIIPHNFSVNLRKNVKFGIYNVGWITWNQTSIGKKCVEDWYNKCIEWCYQKVESNRYADQKYLDFWPEEFDGVKIIQHKGANLALWNVGNYSIKKQEDVIYVDGDRLLFYHFAGITFFNSYVMSGVSKARVYLKDTLRHDIYTFYLRRLELSHGIGLPKHKKSIHNSRIKNILLMGYYRLLMFLYNDKIMVHEFSN